MSKYCCIKFKKKSRMDMKVNDIIKNQLIVISMMEMMMIIVIKMIIFI